MADNLLEIRDLKTWFHTEDQVVRAVDLAPGTTIALKEGHTLGVVGESGSGKSVTAMTIMQLLPPETARIHAGTVSFLGKDIVRLPRSQMRAMRGRDIGMIFQEPMTSLNPVFRVGDQVMEPILIHEKISREEQDEFAVNSHKKAFRAQRMDKFKDEIVPVEIVKRVAGQEVARELIIQDEGVNPTLSTRKAALYPAVFRKGGTVTPR